MMLTVNWGEVDSAFQHLIKGKFLNISHGLIDDTRGACTVKGNVRVAGHVKRVDHGDVFDSLTFRKETLTGHYFILKFDLSWGIRSEPIWAKLTEYFSGKE